MRDKVVRRQTAVAQPAAQEGVMDEDEIDHQAGPEQLSPESYEDLEAWTKLILRKVQRHVARDEPEAEEGEAGR